MKNIRQKIKFVLIALASMGTLCGLILLSIHFFTSLKLYRTSMNTTVENCRHILFLSSYNNLFEETQLQLEGLNSVLTPENIYVDVEYMDLQKYNSEKNLKLFYDMLKYKLSTYGRYEAIILGDDDSLRFALDHQVELFYRTPMIFMCVTDTNLAKLAVKNEFVTGYTAASNINDIIEAGVSINPTASKVYAIYDNTFFGIRDREQFFAASDFHPDMSFIGINSEDYTRPDLIKKLSTIDSRSILICLEAARDAEGRLHSPEDTTFLISKNSPVPVFTRTLHSIGNGFLGGKVTDFEAAGKIVGNDVIKILGGTSLKSIETTSLNNSCYIFDYKALKEEKISTFKLPPDSIIVNRPFDFWYQYGKELLIFAIIVLPLSLLIVMLFHESIMFGKTQEQLKYEAEHDSLTGLPNRAKFNEYLLSQIESKSPFSLLMIDIDDFKRINDFNTHSCGDFVLKTIASRLKDLTKDGKYISARFDGDNFILIYRNHLIEKDPELYYLRQILYETIVFGENSFNMYTNIGIVNSSQQMTEEDYYLNADIALNAARRQGKNKYVFFTEEMKKKVQELSSTEKIIQEACKYGDFNVLYQPQVDTESEQICGYEALIRLADSDISPAVFIPIAERDGHIAKIGRIITEKVIKQLAIWRDEGIKLQRVSINFSSGQINDKSYVTYLKNLMANYRIPPELVGIEITESLFLGNTAQATNLFHQFKNLGIKISLDDFGTGYSALNYLTSLPIDTVKIDKTTIDMYLDTKPQFIENIVNLVHSLGMTVMVEGVEHTWQYHKLKEFKCDYIQGYVYSKPLKEDEIKDFEPKIQ